MMMMFSAIRKRMHVSPATVVASLALVFAMTGGAYAAGHYLITSTKQISPRVLKQLKGANGANGANGASGAAGAAGATGPGGPQGPQGPKGETGAKGENGKNGTNGTTGFTETLPSEKTEKGDWSVSGIASSEFQFMVASVSFVIPLAKAPTPILVRKGAPTPPHCTGSLSEPGAEPGFLCVFANEEKAIEKENPAEGLESPRVCSFVEQPSSKCFFSQSGVGGGPKADPYGFGIGVVSKEAGFVVADGTWAVTAE
jgi:hypothetical protein